MRNLTPEEIAAAGELRREIERAVGFRIEVFEREAGAFLRLERMRVTGWDTIEHERTARAYDSFADAITSARHLVKELERVP